MTTIHRRSFLQSSLSAAAALSLSKLPCSSAIGDEPAAQQLFGSHGYEPNTLFLTWQRDPTTTMTVQWLAPESDPSQLVHCKSVANGAAKISGTSTIKPYPNTTLKVHRCELTGLEPDGEYEFQLGSASPTYRFRTMPAKANNTIQFVSGGDSGIDEHAIKTNGLAALQDPRFVLIAGDLAYDNGESPETFTSFLQNYHAELVDSDGRLIPMLSCIGNHEVVDGYNGKRSDSPQYLALFDGLFADRTFNVLDFGDYLSLVLLDTNHIAPVAGEQTSWLEQTLADRQDRPHLIVANHVPAYPSHREPWGPDGEPGTGADQRKHWSPLFEKYKVDVVLEHHDHTFKRTHPLVDGHHDKHGVIYLGDGSWGKLRTPHTPEERPYLAAVDEAYHLAVHRLEGEQAQHVALEDSGKVADVCVTTSKRPALRG
ncbi:MAG: fibronectin type III domain-containing protein [Pirellulales bacterium]